MNNIRKMHNNTLNLFNGHNIHFRPRLFVFCRVKKAGKYMGNWYVWRRQADTDRSDILILNLYSNHTHIVVHFIVELKLILVVVVWSVSSVHVKCSYSWFFCRLNRKKEKKYILNIRLGSIWDRISLIGT